MPVPSGTATPWRQLESEDDLIYIRDGHTPGSSDLLAEALRADGVALAVGQALRTAENAILESGYYGYVDQGSDEQLCSAQGETENGEYVDEVYPCTVAYLTLGE